MEAAGSKSIRRAISLLVREGRGREVVYSDTILFWRFRGRGVVPYLPYSKAKRTNTTSQSTYATILNLKEKRQF